MKTACSPQSKHLKANHSWKIFDYLALVVVFLFSFWRFQDVYYPYLHDEVDVYGQGALYVYDHNPTLLPGNIPPEISRGHPLLFYSLYGIILKIFGPTVNVAHSFSLFITTAFLILSYFAISKLFNRSIGLSCLLMVLSNPMIIAQSTLVVPEILLALLTFLAIYSFLQNRFFLYAFFSSLGVLTKETGIILPLLIVAVNHIPKYDFFIVTSKKHKLFLYLPLLIFIIFFTIQKITNGWFFFPLHINYISFEFKEVFKKIINTIYFFGIAQGRFLLSSLFCVCFIFYLKIYFRFQKEFLDKERTIIFLLLYIFSIILFSSLNFHINRYYTVIVIPICIVLSYIINLTLYEKLKYPVIAVCFATIPSLFFIEDKKKFNLDVDLNYKSFVENQMDFFNYLDSLDLYSKSIYMNYPLYQANQDPRFGYIKKKFNSEKKFTDSVEYIAISNLDIYDHHQPRENEVDIVKVFHRDYSIIVLYKVKE